MPDPTVTEYRLGEVEKKLDALATEIKNLPDKLEAKYATKAEMREVDQRLDTMAEEAKTKKTGRTSLMTGLTISAFGIFLTAFISFAVWAVNTLIHVQNLGGN